ncbi:MAG: hypothetical protein U5L96_10360 [Owenweeksia sp.]|nr:hypothetical protein [Owenweeksia sp.]
MIERLDAMLQIPGKLDSNLIDHIELHRRIIDNPYYDDINMGTENFVVATYQNFLFRYPTGVELEEAKKMVDGFPGSLFLQPAPQRMTLYNYSLPVMITTKAR